MQVGSNGASSFVTIDGAELGLNTDKDFSVQFWIRTTIDSRKKMVVLSQKVFLDNSLASQKQKGWAFGVFKRHLVVEYRLRKKTVDL